VPRYDYRGAVRRLQEPPGGYIDQDLQNLNRALIYQGQGRNPY
jgi:hypothetical protein